MKIVITARISLKKIVFWFLCVYMCIKVGLYFPIVSISVTSQNFCFQLLGDNVNSWLWWHLLSYLSWTSFCNGFYLFWIGMHLYFLLRKKYLLKLDLWMFHNIMLYCNFIFKLINAAQIEKHLIVLICTYRVFLDFFVIRYITYCK